MTALASYLSTFLREHLPKRAQGKPSHLRSLCRQLYTSCVLRRRAAEDQAVQA